MIPLLLALQAVASPGDLAVSAYTGLFVPGPQHELYDPVVAPHDTLSPGPALGLRAEIDPFGSLRLGGEAHGAAVGAAGSAGIVTALRVHALLAPRPFATGSSGGAGSFGPYVGAGAGTLGIVSSPDAVGTDLDLATHLAGGARYAVSEGVSVQLDLRYLLTARRDVVPSPGRHGEVLVGIAWVRQRDADGDAVSDADDACRKESETVNGYRDEDGCPDALASLTIRVADLDGRPIEGARVEDGDRTLGTTDASGVLRVSEPLMPGSTFSATVKKGRMNPERIDGFAVGEGANELVVELGWKPGSVLIAAKNDRGEPTAARMKAISTDARIDVAPGPDGTAFVVLEPGYWTLLVDGDGYGIERRDVRITEDAVLTRVDLVLQPAVVTVTEQEVKISQKILFDFDGDTILPESDALIEEVASVLLAHDGIRRLEVQGHTDSKGNDRYNLELSQRRVESVVAALVERGVEPKRLVPVGYGETAPIGDNATEEGREQNRRVQFVILERTRE